MKLKNKIKIIIILLILGVLTLLVNGTYIYFKKQNELNKFTDYKIDLKTLNLAIVEKENCIKEKELYYEDEKGQKYYTSCLEKIVVNNNQNLIKLLKNKNITFEDIISSYLKEPTIYYDGGSKEYNFKNLNVIKCHTLDGNNDIIIGNKVMNINEHYCHEDLWQIDKGDCSFTRTYLIKKKNKPVNDKTEVVVSEYNKKEATVIINKYPAEYLEVGKYYEFIFDNYDEIIIDNKIEDIFENYFFRAYNETDKRGLDQIQESVCKAIPNDLIKKAYNYLTFDDKKNFKNLYSAKAEYKNIDKMIIVNQKNKKITLNKQEVLIVEFTKNTNNVTRDIMIIMDSKTKDILGYSLND